jgi:PKD repeat protein
MRQGATESRAGAIKRCRVVLAGLATLLMLAVWAPAAGAVAVHLPNGRFVGLYLRPGLSATAYEHRTGARAITSAMPASAAAADPNGLFYGNGPVLHTTAPYLVYWDPSGTIPASSRAVLTRYMTDIGQDRSSPNDVYGYRVLPQYSDTTGPAAQGQTFSATSQAISDVRPYPTADTTTCTTMNQNGFAHCITDTQIQNELTRLITSDHLPSGLGAYAPIYFVVTPADVNICQDAGDCSGGPNFTFCAYHSAYTLPGPTDVLYASIPFTQATACQGANLPSIQEPNGDGADVVADNLSHENAEVITDPLVGSGWLTTNGYEVADQCELAGPNNPNNELNSPDGPSSLDAYLPTLGGSESAGTLYDQLINGDPYFTQTLWSNSADSCVSTSPSASFTSPASALPGASASFDPSASSSSNGYTSTTWNWGDGTPNTVIAGAPTATSHTFTAPGTYTVTLTLVDGAGYTHTVSHPVVVDAPPTAAFSASATVVEAGSPVAFDASASSDPNQGGSIAGYAWSFGDGSPAGAGVTTGHVYGAPGSYTVALTVAGSEGLSGTVSHAVTVVAPPVAVLSLVTAHPLAGSPVSFNGGASVGGITAYAWNFGDGAIGSGAAPKHTYAKPGAYTVTLTVVGSAGFTSTRSLKVLIGSPIKSWSLKLVAGKYYLVLTVRHAGTIRVGSAKVSVKRSGKATLKLSLSRAQRRRLSNHKTVKLTIVYTAAHGPRITRTATVKLRR